MKHILWLPYAKPPLTENQRWSHWAPKNNCVQEVRYAAKILAISARLPRGLAHCTVGLHYAPPDRRHRDAENIVPTMKAACDGLIDQGLVPDDTPNYMSKTMPEIHPPMRNPPGPNGSRLWLTVEYKDPK